MGEILVSSAKAAALSGRCTNGGARLAEGGIIPDPLCRTVRARPARGYKSLWHQSFLNMSLNAQDIARIAHLARLELSAGEGERMLAQINGFFAIVEKMRAVDTSGVEPLTHPVAAVRDIALRLREDVPSEPDTREANQRSAPAVERGLFLVPKVIE
jgi:aspartyl-tRNA(Asn)/glutamyl-tRNA(Gln) amidotransferase subunit C